MTVARFKKIILGTNLAGTDNGDGTITIDASGGTGSGAAFSAGTGSPEGVVTGTTGDLYVRVDGATGTTVYRKDSGTATNTGWVAKQIIGSGIVNADVAAGAAIAYAKLALTGSVVEADQSLSDVATGNVSTARHGYAPKAPNVASQFLDGTGAWSTPGSSAGWDTVITKPGDESKSSTTSATIDTDLKFTSVSGGVYEFEFLIIYASPAGGTTPDLKAGVWEDATNRGHYLYYGFATTDAVTFTVNAVGSGATAIAFGTATTNRAIKITGHFVGAGGTFGFFWAQNTSSSNATTVRAGSVLRYRRML